MKAKLLRKGLQKILCYSKILLLIILSFDAECQDRFNTVIYESSKSHDGNVIHSFSIETETYQWMDSLRRVQDIVEVKNDSISSNIENEELQRLRQTASAQILYYESVIDSLMFENFKLKMDLSVIEDKINNLPLSGDSNDYLTTGVQGKYYTHDDLTIESLIAEIQKNGIKHPKVVLAQAILETGWFKSRVCHTHNNLFGLRQPWDGEYFRFERWQDSVKAYRTKVQYKYKGGPYLQWLKDLGYAEDPNYTDKLKILLSGPLKKY